MMSIYIRHPCWFTGVSDGNKHYIFGLRPLNWCNASVWLRTEKCKKSVNSVHHRHEHHVTPAFFASPLKKESPLLYKVSTLDTICILFEAFIYYIFFLRIKDVNKEDECQPWHNCWDIYNTWILFRATFFQHNYRWRSDQKSRITKRFMARPEQICFYVSTQDYRSIRYTLCRYGVGTMNLQLP